MTQIVVHTNAPAVRRQLDRLGERIEDRIISRSLNRTIVGVRTDASRTAREHLNLRARRINRDLIVQRARAGEKQAALLITARATPLIEYGARQLQRGVSVKIKKRRGRKRLRHAFIATMPGSGHRGVFEREIKGGKPVGRLKIHELFSTALAQFFDDESILAPIASRAVDRFGRELDAQIAYEVSKS